MLIKKRTVHFSVQQIMGQRLLPHCFEKTHLTSNIFINLSNAWPEMLWTHTKQNTTAWYCARSNPKLPILQRVLQFYQDFGSSFERLLWVTGIWVVQLLLPEAHIRHWNKLLCNYLIIPLSDPLKIPTATQLEANPVNPVLWQRIKPERSQRLKAAILVAIPPLAAAQTVMPSNPNYLRN